MTSDTFFMIEIAGALLIGLVHDEPAPTAGLYLFKDGEEAKPIFVRPLDDMETVQAFLRGLKIVGELISAEYVQHAESIVLAHAERPASAGLN